MVFRALLPELMYVAVLPYFAAPTRQRRRWPRADPARGQAPAWAAPSPWRPSPAAKRAAPRSATAERLAAEPVLERETLGERQAGALDRGAAVGEHRLLREGGEPLGQLQRPLEVARRASTTSLTRPIRCASSASTGRPVRISSRARPRPTTRGSRWVPPSISGTPQRRSKQPKVEPGGGDPQVAPERQLEAAGDAPAVDRGDRRLRRGQPGEAHRARPGRRRRARRDLRSKPAQKASPPAPVRTSTRRLVVGLEVVEAAGAAPARSRSRRRCGTRAGRSSGPRRRRSARSEPPRPRAPSSHSAPIRCDNSLQQRTLIKCRTPMSPSVHQLPQRRRAPDPRPARRPRRRRGRPRRKGALALRRRLPGGALPPRRPDPAERARPAGPDSARSAPSPAAASSRRCWRPGSPGRCTAPTATGPSGSPSRCARSPAATSAPARCLRRPFPGVAGEAALEERYARELARLARRRAGRGPRFVFGASGADPERPRRRLGGVPRSGTLDAGSRRTATTRELVAETIAARAHRPRRLRRGRAGGAREPRLPARRRGGAGAETVAPSGAERRRARPPHPGWMDAERVREALAAAARAAPIRRLHLRRRGGAAEHRHAAARRVRMWERAG